MVNQSLLKMFGHTDSALVGGSTALLPAQENQHYIEEYSRAAAQNLQRKISHVQARCSDDKMFPASISISGLAMRDRSLRFVVAIANLSHERPHLTLTNMQVVPN